MIVKNYRDFVGEGLWKQTVNRAKENEIRLGDRLNTNVYDIEPVDFGLPFYVADRLLEVENNTQLSYAEVEVTDEAKHIRKLGWRVPTMDELKELFKCVHVHYTYVGHNSYFSLQKDGKESNVFIEKLDGARNRKTFREIWTSNQDESLVKCHTVFIEEPMIASQITTSKKAQYLKSAFLLIKDKK